MRPDNTFDFEGLRSRQGQAAAILVAYDVMEVDGQDMRPEALEERRKRLSHESRTADSRAYYRAQNRPKSDLKTTCVSTHARTFQCASFEPVRCLILSLGRGRCGGVSSSAFLAAR
jgi:hypothetical protein